jgi:hypothetical protein
MQRSRKRRSRRTERFPEWRLWVIGIARWLREFRIGRRRRRNLGFLERLGGRGFFEQLGIAPARCRSHVGLLERLDVPPTGCGCLGVVEPLGLLERQRRRWQPLHEQQSDVEDRQQDKL